jgi:NAD(P)-dependent dehydrogenase (short-subunit alcohol dehydrogenase family)
MLGASTIVTGARHGIGLATARLLAARGGGVHGVDIQPTPTDLQQPGVVWHEVDVTDQRQVAAFFAAEVHPGSLTGLVNCAGVVEHSSLLDGSVEDAAGRASIVNVSSVNAHYGHPRRLGYAVAKGGVETLTRLAACQLADRGIRVNTVVPGAIATRMTPDADAGDRCVLGRIGEPGEVAAAIAFLLSDDASYITGATLHVDGGYGLQ